MRVDLISREISIVAQSLKEMCRDDDRLFQDCLEGETNIDGACARLLEMIETEEGNAAALTAQMAHRKDRRDACEARIETLKAGIQKIMGAGMVKTLKLPEATISVRPVAAKLKIVDAEAVPDQFKTAPEPKPSLTKINETYNVDGALPNWLTVEPARTTLSIRRA